MLKGDEHLRGMQHQHLIRSLRDMSDSKNQPRRDDRDKVQELHPPKREKINQGQQFDEMQRQEKNPDGKPQEP
jgi:hypothetical protein